MTAQEILAEIKPLGRDSYRNVLFNHGVTEPCYGVKIDELKKIQKRIKMVHPRSACLDVAVKFHG